jgi:hypothetical protein
MLSKKRSASITLLVGITLALSLLTARAQGFAADTGFRPGEHGFAFENYGGDAGATNLTPSELVRLFGPGVCIKPPDEKGNCKLTAPAAMWMEEANKAMDGGHCEGFAVLSLFLYDKTIPTDIFGAGSVNQLALKGNTPLQREIALWFITQGLPQVQEKTIRGKPSFIVQRLIEGYKNKEFFTGGFYMPDGSSGHAVTPYAVKDLGGGQYHIMIYDNNFPGQERFIEVDANAETWKYEGSPNPETEPFTYTGDGDSQTLEITPQKLRLDKPTCPFCNQTSFGNLLAGLPASTTASTGGGSGSQGSGETESGASEADELSGQTQIMLNGRANIIITDEQGRKTGFADGKVLTEIPNSQVILPKSKSGAKRAPIVVVPAGGKYTVNVTEMGGSNPASSLSVIRRGNVLAGRQFNLKQQPVGLSISGDTVQFKATGDKKPVVVQQGYTTANGSNVTVAVTGRNDTTMKLDPNGKIQIQGKSGPGQLLVTRTDPEGKSKIYYSSKFELKDDDFAALDVLAWEDDIGVDYFDENGNADGSATLTDEPLNKDLLGDFEVEDDFFENFDDEKEFDDQWGDEAGDQPSASATDEPGGDDEPAAPDTKATDEPGDDQKDSATPEASGSDSQPGDSGGDDGGDNGGDSGDDGGGSGG